jgi:hypothetical protein
MSDSKWYSTPQEAMVADLNKQREMIDALRKQLEEQGHNLDIAIGQNEIIDAKLDVAENGLHEVDNWARAYPLDIFPEPDFKRVRELLEAGGITLDSVSASNMRHVVKGVERIVSEALAEINRIGKLSPEDEK